VWRGTIAGKSVPIEVRDDVNDGTWEKSGDGVLALRLAVNPATAKAGEPVHVVATLRNLSDKPVAVLRPLSDEQTVVFDWLEIRGPQGRLKTTRPHADTSSYTFARIAPGDSVEDWFQVAPGVYEGLHRPGRYTISIDYKYAGNADAVAEKSGLKSVWRGTIRSKSVSLTVREDVDGWVKSADGVLALRLGAGAGKPGDPIRLIASLRNRSDKPVNVLRPCGDEYRARSASVELVGPTGQLKYTGPNRSYTLGKDAFVTLEPGDTISDVLAVTTDNRKGSDAAGEYRLTFTYEAVGGDRSWADNQFKLPGVWVGSIKSETVTVKKAEPKLGEEPQPAADEKARLFGAFRADVEPIVRKLPKEAADHWLAELRDEKKWSVRRQPFADALKRVENTLSPEEKKTAILRGTIPDLKRDGDCWEVHFFDGIGNSLTGYLDPRTSKLVFLWVIPEG
jgi:hypothetical protein